MSKDIMSSYKLCAEYKGRKRKKKENNSPIYLARVRLDSEKLMATVYVTQIPVRRDQLTGASVPAMNISPANEHGGIVVMMPPRAAFIDSTELMKQLRVHLDRYSLPDRDCLLPIGDPVIMAAACAILGERGGFNVLKWDKNMGRYLSILIAP